MPRLSFTPLPFCPMGRYMQERMEVLNEVHRGPFLWPEEWKLLHYFMIEYESAFVWTDEEQGYFQEDFFPLVRIPVVPHIP